MKLRESNTNPLKDFLDKVPFEEKWVSRTDLEIYTVFFASAGWGCECDEDIYTVLKFIAEEGLISIDVDEKNRIRKIKRNYPVIH